MARWIPRAKLLARPLLVASAFHMHWMTDELKKQTATAPALASGVNFTRLENDDEAFLDFDGAPWMPAKVRASALTLSYSIGWINTTSNSWIHTAQEEEQKWRDVLLADYASRLTDLRAQATDAKDEALAELQKEIRELENLEEQLKPGGIGFLRTSYGAMKTNVSGVFWGLAAPNVPVEFTSAFKLQRDRSISFRLLRYKAPKEQAKYEYRVEFEGGKTCYGLIFGDDGNSAQFIHYRPMTPEQRKAKRDRIERLLDNGRLTPADKQKLIAWQDEERSIEVTASKREQGKTELTKTEKQRIAVLHAQADVLSQKQLTPAQEKERQKLENELYLAQEPFSLQENALDLLGQAIDVTVQFLRAGYVLVRCGATTFVYENSRVTGAEPHVFHFGLPDQSTVRINSDGGKWGLVWGAPIWGQGGEGVLRSAPFEWAQPLTPLNCVYSVVGDAQGDASMTANLRELRAPVVGPQPQPGLYQIELLLKGGQYTPEIYSFSIHRPAEMEEQDDVIWDSTMEVLSPLRDVLLDDDRRRSRHAQVVISRPLSKLQDLPEAAVGLTCEIKLYDRNNDTEHSFLHYGYVAKSERARVRELVSVSGLSAIDLAGGEWVLDVVGCEGFLAKPIQAFVQGDGMWPGDYVRLLCADALLPEHLWSRIPTGAEAHRALGWNRIPPTRPGRYPHFKPRPNHTFWAQIAATVNNHCPGGALWNDGQGLRLDKNPVRDKRAKNYRNPPEVSVHSPLCLRNQEGFKLTHDLRDYKTCATVVGRKDPLTGLRVVGSDSIPQASDERFKKSAFYVGHDIPYDAEPDDSLTNKAACERAAQDKLCITPLTPDGLAPLWGDIDIDLDPDFLTSDLIRIFGINFLSDTIDLGSLQGENAGRMRVNVQLAQDAELRGLI